MEADINITEKVIQKAPLRPSRKVTDEEKEIIECLARLKVWRDENLMSPNGMDRFVCDGRTMEPVDISGVSACAAQASRRKAKSKRVAGSRKLHIRKGENK